MANEQQNTYEQLPNNFLETSDDPAAVSQADQDLQQRIISGEYAPEPAEYCNVSNEAYAGFDPFGQGNPQFNQQYQQIGHPAQYAQIEDPWMVETTNVYAQEEYEPTMNEDQYMYSDQPTSSAALINNPFEEEEEYEPMPVTIQPMRRLGQPPTKPPPQRYGQQYITIQRGTQRPNNESPTNARQNMQQVRRVRRQPQPRRESMDDDPFISKDVTDKARSQAAQRVATPEGWNCLNQWLRKAYESDDREKIINLLETCKTAEISADLLRITDTPKIVKEIARKHPNATINRLSNELIGMWKAVIVTDTKAAKQRAKTPVKVEKPASETKAKEKQEQSSSTITPASNYVADENLLDKLTEAMDKNVLSREEGAGTSNATNPDTVKRPRVKAKVKLSNSRRTGLEGDDETTTIKKEKVTTATKKKTDQPIMIPPKVVAPPKRSLQESDMFLAAFDTQDKKAAGTKRLKANKVVKILQPDVPTNKEVAVKSDFNIKTEDTPLKQSANVVETIDQVPVIPRVKGGGILRRSALTVEEKSVRKIRFSDQFNKPLVDVQYFDIEEGERINVNRNYDHDRIKRWEMEDEGKQLRMHHMATDADPKASPITVDDPSLFTGSSTGIKPEPTSPILLSGKKDSMPPLPLSNVPIDPNTASAEWPLIQIEELRQFVRGANSKLHELAAERERNTMAAFVDPNTPTDAVGEEDPELELAANEALEQTPLRIPLTLQQPQASNGDDEKPSAKDSDDITIDDESSHFKSNVPVRKLPLPFSSSSINQTSAIETPAYSTSPVYPVSRASPPIVTSSEPVNKVDAFIELLKKTAANQADLVGHDKDLRNEPADVDMDQDLRSPDANPNDDNYMDTPLSPPPETDMDVQVMETPATLTADVLSSLAALAGKDSGVVAGGFSALGGLNLADILSKVESAQSGTTTDSGFQQHQYAQENLDSVPPTVITQIHGEFFQQPKYVAGHPYHAKPGMPTRFAAPGIRPTSTNPRGGYFQTPTNMSRFRTVPCKYFLAGTCNFGEACRFLHTTPDGQIVPHQPVVSQQQQQFPPASALSPSKVPESNPADGSSSSFQLALSSSKTSTQSIEAAANFLQRGNFRGRRGYQRGSTGYRRGDYEDRHSRGRDRRSPRRYDERCRHSPNSRRSRRRSHSNSSGGSADGRLSPDYEDGRNSRKRSGDRREKRAESRERSPERDRSRSPPRKERSRSPSYDRKSPSSPPPGTR